MESKANIICFEGMDGVGKSTQIKILADNLKIRGLQTAVVKLPRYDKWTGKLILRMLRSGSVEKFPNLFQVIQWFDKILFQVFDLPKLLKNNDYVLFDRWLASMWVYGLASGANHRLTTWLVDWLVNPDLTCLFEGNSKRRKAQDYYESNVTLQKSVKLHYNLWMHSYDNVVCVIDANKDKGEISSLIEDVVLTFTENKK
jgi:thymidylate kinase